MSKGCYVAVDGTARKVKKKYVVVNGATRKVKKKYVVVNQRTVPAVELPEGYVQLNYVESTGDQYVDTGFKPNQDTRVLMDVDVLRMGSSDRFLFGTRVAYQDTSINLVSTSGNNSWIVGYGNISQTISGQCTGRHTIDYNKNTIAIGDTGYSFTATTFAPDYAMYLFACNQSGTAISGEYAIMRLYSCKIYDNGTLVRNYVPCKNAGGTVGLYDTVSDSFVSSATSIDLAAGTEQVNATKLVYQLKDKLVYHGYSGLGFLNADTYRGAAAVGNYALFAGGISFSGSDATNYVDAYNASLTRSTPTALSAGRYAMAGATVGNYALFAGGLSDSGSDPAYRSTVDAYNPSLTRSTPTALSAGRYAMAGATVGNYALFAGGMRSSYPNVVDIVDAYNASLTRSTPTALSAARQGMGAATVGKYALFAGGLNASGAAATVDAYNASLTRSTPTALSAARDDMAATTLGEYAMFAGGLGGSSKNSQKYATVDAYNESLTRSTPTALKEWRYSAAGATVGDYALFGGGWVVGDSSSERVTTSLVEAYTLE